MGDFGRAGHPTAGDEGALAEVGGEQLHGEYHPRRVAVVARVVRRLDVAVGDAADGSSPAIDRVADGSMTNGRAVDRAR